MKFDPITPMGSARVISPEIITKQATVRPNLEVGVKSPNPTVHRVSRMIQKGKRVMRNGRVSIFKFIHAVLNWVCMMIY